MWHPWVPISKETLSLQQKQAIPAASSISFICVLNILCASWTLKKSHAFWSQPACIQSINSHSVALCSSNKYAAAEWKTGQSTTVCTVKVMTKMWNEYEDKWHMDPIPRGEYSNIIYNTYYVYISDSYQAIFWLYTRLFIFIPPPSDEHYAWPWDAPVWIQSILLSFYWHTLVALVICVREKEKNIITWSAVSNLFSVPCYDMYDILHLNTVFLCMCRIVHKISL